MNFIDRAVLLHKNKIFAAAAIASAAMYIFSCIVSDDSAQMKLLCLPLLILAFITMYATMRLIFFILRKINIIPDGLLSALEIIYAATAVAGFMYAGFIMRHTYTLDAIYAVVEAGTLAGAVHARFDRIK